jgi:hypothetical protein
MGGLIPEQLNKALLLFLVCVLVGRANGSLVSKQPVNGPWLRTHLPLVIFGTAWVCLDAVADCGCGAAILFCLCVSLWLLGAATAWRPVRLLAALLASLGSWRFAACRYGKRTVAVLLLHLAAPCCALLHLAAPCCTLLRPAAPCCALLRIALLTRPPRRRAPPPPSSPPQAVAVRPDGDLWDRAHP